MEFEPIWKQHLCFQLLKDEESTEIIFGGGAGGGKSFLGCAWIIISALQYAETRWLIGRSQLSTLKQTTLISFFDVAKLFGLKNGDDFSYNKHDNIITFKNGSIVLLKDLQHQPSDPMYDSLGSLEITGAFCDEVSQISRLAWETIQSRIRYKLDQYGITPKILGTTNPSKNWVKFNFYDPYVKGELPKHRKFVKSLLKDNPKVYKGYAESLSRMNEVSRRRLLDGDWDYEDDAYALFTQDTVDALFSGHDYSDGKYYISADIARLGKDSTVILVWNGMNVIEFVRMTKVPTDFTTARIKALMDKYKIPRNQVIIDEDGIGGACVDSLKCKGFIAQTQAYNKENYKNLKTQCYYKLAETRFSINVNSMIEGKTLEEYITEELQSVKQKVTEGKLMISTKDEQKSIINRSPDISDALMMRMVFNLHKSKSSHVFSSQLKKY